MLRIFTRFGWAIIFLGLGLAIAAGALVAANWGATLCPGLVG